MISDSSSNKTPAKSMADLMASHKTSVTTFKKGDIIKGKIKKLTKSEILVDIKAKTDAVVLEKDRTLLQALLDSLHVGDEVEVSILNPESDFGNSVVSLRRFLSDAAWKILEQAQKEEKQIPVTVTDVTKGGVVVVTESGLSGFLPNSHMSVGDQQLTPGKKLKVRVIETLRKESKIIFSQKLTVTAQAFDDAIKAFSTGKKVEVTVANIAPFGLFVTVPVPDKTAADGTELVLDGLIHISEIAWEKVEDLAQLYTPGQELEAKIIGFDKNTRRIDLSIKQLISDPFEIVANNYPIDKKVTVLIVKIDDTGAYLDLGDGVEGVIRKEKIPPTVTYQKGQTITATVSEVDRRRHRISLVPVLLEKPLMYR